LKWIQTYLRRQSCPSCSPKHSATQTYVGVEVYLHAFLSWDGGELLPSGPGNIGYI
jgi:hypothetical protein